MVDGAGIGATFWDVMLAAINFVQIVVLAWLASHPARVRRRRRRNGIGRNP